MYKYITITFIIIVFVGCSNQQELFDEQEHILNELSRDLELSNELLQQQIIESNQLVEKNEFLEEQLSDLKEEHSALSIKLESQVNEEIPIPSINNWKYNEPSGIMKYIGDVGVRTFPHNDAPIITDPDELDYDDLILFCRAVISVGYRGNNSPKWGVVLVNDWGRMKVGYVPYSELEKYEYPEYDYIESLNGFQVGDRIEKLIGTLDRDFTIITENACIYRFHDLDEEDSFSLWGEPRLDVFVSNDFRVDFLRTNSSKYILNTGYKVGDNAKDVIGYYATIYPESNVDQMISQRRYEFQISDDEYIRFYIDEDDLTEESLISSIELF